MTTATPPLPTPRGFVRIHLNTFMIWTSGDRQSYGTHLSCPHDRRGRPGQSQFAGEYLLSPGMGHLPGLLLRRGDGFPRPRLGPGLPGPRPDIARWRRRGDPQESAERRARYPRRRLHGDPRPGEAGERPVDEPQWPAGQADRPRGVGEGL